MGVVSPVVCGRPWMPWPSARSRRDSGEHASATSGHSRPSEEDVGSAAALTVPGKVAEKEWAWVPRLLLTVTWDWELLSLPPERALGHPAAGSGVTAWVPFAPGPTTRLFCHVHQLPGLQFRVGLRKKIAEPDAVLSPACPRGGTPARGGGSRARGVCPESASGCLRESLCARRRVGPPAPRVRGCPRRWRSLGCGRVGVEWDGSTAPGAPWASRPRADCAP